MNQLKMTSQDDATESIVVSFAAKWREPLLEQNVSVVFRKRGPANFDPDLMYLYVGSPVSALIGRAKITQYERLPIDEAVQLAEKGCIGEEELRSYAAGYDDLAVFHLGPLEAAKSEIALSTLSSKFGFSPPQSFLVLSESGRDALDGITTFTVEAA